MELKDVILSTLAEMEDTTSSSSSSVRNTDESLKSEQELPIKTKDQEIKLNDTLKNYTVDNELFFLNSVRERLLVLFEGFQAPNNSNIEAKVDLTLNFLEYLLATIDNRVEIIEKETNSGSI